MVKKYVEDFAKYGGLATVAVEWFALAYYYFRLPQYFGGQYPISFYATLPETKIIFSGSYILAAVFFWIFIRYHVHTIYPIPKKLFAISQVLFIALAITPFDPENIWLLTIHNILGLTSGILLVIAMWLLAKRSNNTYVSFITYTAVIVSTILLVIFLITPTDNKLVFLFEASSWLAIQLWLLLISVHMFKKKKRG